MSTEKRSHNCFTSLHSSECAIIIMLLMGVPGFRVKRARIDTTEHGTAAIGRLKDKVDVISRVNMCPLGIPVKLGGYGFSLSGTNEACCQNGSPLVDYAVGVNYTSNRWEALDTGVVCRKCGEQFERDHDIRVELRETWFEHDDGYERWVWTHAVSVVSKQAQFKDSWSYSGNGYVLFLYPYYDYNGAFAFKERLCKRLTCWTKRGFKIKMQHVRSVTQAYQIVSSFPDRGIDHVVLGGHGSPTQLVWNVKDGTPLSRGALVVGGANTDSFLALLKQKMKETHGTVLLDSCLTGKDVPWGDNLFKYVADRLPDQKITAANVSLTDDLFKRRRHVDHRDAMDDAEVDSSEACIAGDAVRFAYENGTSATVTSVPSWKRSDV
eukprot:TRINITY_DN20337_c0_g1_i1.p1 TRINITY_DN20337_c0_g1~~TRINITY_DN20337_c0_g1_i1.p1  ORF type:complete len:380 (+),score=30.29 TRINITY_DN20337_c0_g1_i1:156-1295(+)